MVADDRASAASDLVDFVVGMRPALVRSLTVVCRDRGVAEELAQETLIRGVVRIRDLRVMDRPDLWLHRVALNLARSWIRRRVAERRATRRMLRARDGVEPPWPLDPELHARLAELSRRQREVLSLVYLVDLSVADAAELLGISVGTAKSHLSRGLAHLREALSERSLGDVRRSS